MRGSIASRYPVRTALAAWVAVLVACALTTLMIPACNKEGDNKGSAGGGKKKIVIGMIAKSQSNDVFVAARKGAEDAAKKLGPQYGADVEINWQTPVDEDAQKQADFVTQLASSGVQGIAISCTEANTVTPAIKRAIDSGVPVMCFDSDAPRSGRFAFFGTDDEKCGQVVAEELAKEMGGKGTIAVLAGNAAAANLQNRVKGFKDEMGKHPEMKIIDVVHHEETKEKAAEAVNQEQSTNPSIQGWGFVGGWPLFTKNALKWEPGAIKVVSVDALPPMLDYLEDGHVEALYLQHSYAWGERSVQILLDKIVKGQDPSGPGVENGRVVDTLEKVTKADVPRLREEWKTWLGK